MSPFIYIHSEHPKPLKNNIPYSQALQLKKIRSTKNDFDYCSRELKERFLKEVYDQKLVDEQLEKVRKFNIPCRTGKCTPCLLGSRTLCCNQVLRKNRFMNQQTKGTFNFLFKETKKPNSILACKHFQEKGHNFNKHVKFIIIHKLVNLLGSKEALRKMLVIRENFWIQKLVPFGLNQGLSK